MSFELPKDPNFWVAVGTIALAIVTFILAFVTYLALRETKKMRIAGQQPSFSLEPSTFALGGSFYGMNLVNHGQTASAVKINCMWGVKLEESGGSGHSFFILSLAKDSRASLDGVPVAEIVTGGHVLKLEIECNDVSGEEYKTTIRVDFSKIKGTSTKIGYQNDYRKSIHTDLDNITSALRSLESRLEKIASKIR